MGSGAAAASIASTAATPGADRDVTKRQPGASMRGGLAPSGEFTFV